MIYINITNFVLISSLVKNHSMIETRRLKSVVFFQTISTFVLSRKFINIYVVISLFIGVWRNMIFIDHTKTY